MLTYMLCISVLAYLIITFMTYSEYKVKFKGKPMSTRKGFYIFAGISMTVIGCVFLIVLGYLILTM